MTIRPLVMLTFLAVLAATPWRAGAQEPISLRDMGSFHVGGREVVLSGKPVRDVVLTPGSVPARIDPNGAYLVEHLYAQYFLVQNRRGQLPLLMWHGGGLTGVSFETTPDGRPGWLNHFLRRGWDVYVSDAVERGRAGWAPFPDIFPSEPLFTTKGTPWQQFRIGPGQGSWNEDPTLRKLLPGSQFPVEAYASYVRQIVPRWTTTDEAILKAYVALIDKVCPCVILYHSQAGQFGFKAAQARPDKVKALIAVEPSSFGETDKVAALKDIPILAVYGDYIDQDARWPTIRGAGLKFYDLVRAAGGSVEVMNLPERGLRGNSHMMMMDKNNLQVADLIQEWIAGKGFWK